jgi:hypothetical protein
VQTISRENGVDPKLVDALVRVESSYDPNAVSRRGAMGLMQLMPATAKRLDVDDPFDPEKNIRGGIKEFSRSVCRDPYLRIPNSHYLHRPALPDGRWLPTCQARENGS